MNAFIFYPHIPTFIHQSIHPHILLYISTFINSFISTFIHPFMYEFIHPSMYIFTIIITLLNSSLSLSHPSMHFYNSHLHQLITPISIQHHHILTTSFSFHFECSVLVLSSICMFLCLFVCLSVRFCICLCHSVRLFVFVMFF